MLHIALEDPAQAEIMRLLRAGEEYSAQLYPAESNHHLALEALRGPDVRFFVARDGERAVATGALVLHGGWGELKRMWVVPTRVGQVFPKQCWRRSKRRHEVSAWSFCV